MGVISRYKVPILKAVIECGLLRRILHTADLCDLLEILPNASAERESRDMWRHVMKEAKDAGLLGDDEAVRGAVDGGVLDVPEGDEKVARPGTAGVKVLSRFSFIQHLDELDIFRALTSSEIVVVQRKLVEQAKEAGVMSDVLIGAQKCVELPFWCYGGTWKLPAILTAAKEAGVLTDLLHSASTHGLLGMTVAAAEEAGVLTDLLHSASTHGLLGMTVAAAEEAGVLTDVSLYVRPVSSAMVVVFNRYVISNICMFRIRMMLISETGGIDDVARAIQKAHLLCLSWFLWILLTLVRGRVLCRTRDAEHCKCVISHVTICSGDIERNPGPDVILNDWLKDVYSELVRRWKGCQKKNIPWKQFGLPDPRNSGLDRNKLFALISRLGLLTQRASHDTSDIYAKEFQLLRDNIHDIKKLDLEVLDSIVKVRKILVKARELDDYMSLLSEDERRKAQGSVNDLQLRHVALQGGQVAVEEQREEVEVDPVRRVQISDGPLQLPQPNYPLGSAVTGDEANIPALFSIEDRNSTLGTLEELNPFDLNESDIEFVESLLYRLEETSQSVSQNEARSPKGDAHADHTATVLSCQRSGPKERNDSETTMEDTADVTADEQTLQTPGPTDVPSQSQKSQNFAIAPNQAPASTTSSPPVLTTDASIQSRHVLLVQNLENIFGIPDLDSRRVNENEGTRFPISRKRSHSSDSGSNCRSNKMTRFT